MARREKASPDELSEAVGVQFLRALQVAMRSRHNRGLATAAGAPHQLARLISVGRKARGAVYRCNILGEHKVSSPRSLAPIYYKRRHAAKASKGDAVRQWQAHERTPPAGPPHQCTSHKTPIRSVSPLRRDPGPCG